ncbi:ABC transporter substrate-binding protein [Spirillospora sp. NPDC047279]|uniref:ABC transporter substrate-binding protein n=1 Tax=Spirillospora sp. NPDC047279 TaxID=3155478 RepID=UPI0033EAEDA0
MPRPHHAVVRALALAGAGALLLAGCGGGSGGASGTEYNWGINAELSGATSAYGKTLQQGIQAYVDEVNAAGGINGHKIKLTALDNGGEQSRAAANTTQLATARQVNAIFGNVLSANCSAAQPIAVRNKVPLACISVAEPNPYVFSIGPDNARAAQPLFDAAKKVTGKSNPKTAFVYLNTLTDLALAKKVKAQAAGAGIDLAVSEEVDLMSADYSSQTAKVVAAKPDVVLISHTGPGLLSVLKGVRAAGIDAPLVWLDGTANLASLSSSTDKNLYAMTVYSLVEPGATQEGAKAYTDAVKSKIKDPTTLMGLNDGEAVMGYLSARAFGEAMKACGHPCSGEKLKGQLEKLQTSIPGIVDAFGYTAGDHYPFKNWYLYNVVGSKATLTQTLDAGSS